MTDLGFDKPLEMRLGACPSWVLSFCCSLKNSLLIDGSLTSTRIMAPVPYVSRKRVLLVVACGEQ